MLRADAALLLLVSLLPSSQCNEVPMATYTSNSFNDSQRDVLAVLGDAGISQGALQLTPDSLNQASNYLVNKSGRILLAKPFKLWEPLPSNSSNSSSPNHVVSFNTSFTINVYWPNSSAAPGEGLAFLLASSAADHPVGSSGGYLGLTNSTLNGNRSNNFVAIEFDTVKQSYDPDANHIGLDINSVVSNVTAPLPLEIAPPPTKPANYTVWIVYDGAARRVRVYMAREGQQRPAGAALDAPLDLSEHLAQKSYFGFAGSTGLDFELNCVLAWNLTVEQLSDSGGGGTAAWKVAVAVGVPAAALAAVAAGFFVGRYLRKRRVQDDPTALAGTLKSLPGMPREFEFKELKRATNNFDDANKLGQGGFGVVYKGVLDGDNTVVAVKMFSRDNTNGQDDFLAELSIINRLRHKNLVRIIGWCHQNGVLLLVYEYMPNGSLDHHLFDGGPDRPLLSWSRRYKVVAGVASALHYLHNEYDQKVVHRDIKASNVLLDAAFNARLGDFGLARALDTDKTSYADLQLGGVPGTLGYIAPECFHTGKATRESDVFAFGALLLEVACGLRPRCDVAAFRFLADWVWSLHRDRRILDAVDPRLDGAYFDAAEAERLLLLGLACSHPLPADRPKAQQILQVISGSVPAPDVPPFKPAFVWPSYGEDDGGATASTNRAASSVVTSSSYYASSSAAWSPQNVISKVNADDTSIV